MKHRSHGEGRVDSNFFANILKTIFTVVHKFGYYDELIKGMKRKSVDKGLVKFELRS